MIQEKKITHDLCKGGVKMRYCKNNYLLILLLFIMKPYRKILLLSFKMLSNKIHAKQLQLFCYLPKLRYIYILFFVIFFFLILNWNNTWAYVLFKKLHFHNKLGFCEIAFLLQSQDFNWLFTGNRAQWIFKITSTFKKNRK